MKRGRSTAVQELHVLLVAVLYLVTLATPLVGGMAQPSSSDDISIVLLDEPVIVGAGSYPPGSDKDSSKPGDSADSDYVVRPGDCLWDIARRYYGDPHRWREIYNANADQITNPNLIYPGQRFVIPGGDDKSGAAVSSPSGQSPAQSDRRQGPTGSGSFNQVPPLEHASISSNYGMRLHPIKGVNKHHDGIDLSCAGGTPIRATGPGRVIRADWGSGYGNVVKVQHPDGTVTVYAHCRAFTCAVGDEVKAGQQIATVNSTGLSTGDHLHFEVQQHGRALDPRDFFSFPAQGASY